MMTLQASMPTPVFACLQTSRGCTLVGLHSLLAGIARCPRLVLQMTNRALSFIIAPTFIEFRWRQCKVRARYDRHGQARYWKGLGFAVERTPPATENFVREISAGRVFPLSAALDRVHWLLSQQKKVFREGEAISLFSGMHGT